MPDPAPPPSALDRAQARLSAALDRLEARLAAGARPTADGGEAARLRTRLAESEARERELEALAADASAALGRAAAEVRAALQAEA